MLKESIIFVMLILFSIEDIRKKKNRCPAIVGISGDRNTISGNHKVFDHTGNLWRRILGSVFARNRQSDR